MQFQFYFFDRNECERYREENKFDRPVEALRQAQRIADQLVTDPAYLCDFGNAYLRVESADAAISMRFSIKALLDMRTGHSAPRPGAEASL
jgi:hypothetical protein